MTRFPNLTVVKIIQVLKRAGFVEHESRGSHRTYKNPVTGYRTTVSFHSGDVSRSLMKEIIRQAGLSEDEFRKFL